MALTSGREEEFLHRLTRYTEENLTNEQFGVSDLASKMGMSRSNLHRKVKSSLGISISRFICQIRLKKAMELLRNSSSSISDVAFEVGFQSVSYFIKCFHDYYGYPPGKMKLSKSGTQKTGGSAYSGKKVSLWKIVSLWEKKRFPAPLTSLLIVLLTLLTLVLIFYHYRPGQPSSEKSIAVLPFINDSPEESEMYFINGCMEAILNHLSKIEDLRITSRTSVEQYRNTNKSIREIAKELNVNYILEGSGIKHGDQIRLSIQLIDALNDKHLWAESFDKNSEDVFGLYSEVAQLVAGHMQVVISPEEKKRIENIPTTNLAAFDLWQKGEEELRKYLLDRSNLEALEKSRKMYEYSIEFDSSFAEPYVGIGWIHWETEIGNQAPNYKDVDSILQLANKALELNDQLAEAYNLRGYCYQLYGEIKLARQDFKNALDLAPNLRASIHGLAWIAYLDDDFLTSIRYFHKACQIDRGQDYPNTLMFTGYAYFNAGFKDEANFYAKKALDLNGDSASYYHALATSEWFISKDTTKALHLLQQAYLADSCNIKVLSSIGRIYQSLGNYSKSLNYYEEYMQRLTILGQEPLWDAHRIGQAYLSTGDRETAEYYFDKQLQYFSDSHATINSSHVTKAEVYALRGEKEKVYKHLNEAIIKKNGNIYSGHLDRYIFRSYLDDPEFIKLARDLKALYQIQHDKIGNWLKDHSLE